MHNRLTEAPGTRRLYGHAGHALALGKSEILSVVIVLLLGAHWMRHKEDNQRSGQTDYILVHQHEAERSADCDTFRSCPSRVSDN